jgi:Host cell surface-exposed lipoprotein
MNTQDPNYGQRSDDGNYWWDGDDWQPTSSEPFSQPVPHHTKQGRKVNKKVLIGLGVAFGLVVLIGAAMSGGEEQATPAPAKPSAAAPKPTPTAVPTPTPTPTVVAPPTPTISSEQQNALESAQDYLDYSGFSRSGLIDQLEYEGYSNSIATWAADNSGADWNEECVQSAQAYLDYGSFSKSGLADQLEYEGFTQAQINYAIAEVY